MRIMYVLTVSLIVTFAGLAFANPLPCEPTREDLYSFRWQPGTGEITSYMLHVGTSPGVYDQQELMHSLIEDSDGNISGLDGTFASDTTWYVVMTAVGPGGESEYSNEAIVEATTRICEVPGPPVILEEIKVVLTKIRDLAIKGLVALEGGD